MTRDVGAPRFDLEERTARFGENAIRFAKRLAMNPITEPLIKQLVRHLGIRHSLDIRH
jgi:hypothetical protein